MGEINLEKYDIANTGFFAIITVLVFNKHSWRGGRVVECTGLENRNIRNGIEGSNPSPSTQI